MGMRLDIRMRRGIKEGHGDGAEHGYGVGHGKSASHWDGLNIKWGHVRGYRARNGSGPEYGAGDELSMEMG